MVWLKFVFAFITASFIFCSYASAAPPASFFFNTSGNNVISNFPNILDSSSIVFEVITDRFVTCRYGQNSGVSYSAMDGTFELNFGNVHKKNLIDLPDGTHTFYVACRNSTDTSNNLLAASFNTLASVSAQIIFSDEPPFNAGLISFSLVTSRFVQGTPSLSYSFNGVSYSPIPLFGGGVNWQGYFIIPQTINEAIGSFQFNAIDLEGRQGSDITSGSVFIIDNVKPKTLVNFAAIGYQSRIELHWQTDDVDIVKYELYRTNSPNVGYSDFYKEIDGVESYIDTSVELGKTYYYRISAIDSAGNEGELSIESFATVLRSDVNSSTGLPLHLHGFVDNALSNIDLILGDIAEIEKALEFKKDDEKNILIDIGIFSDINAAKSELNFLKGDISKYKLQSLSNSELTNKLNAAELKIGTIKKKVPEDLIVSERRNLDEGYLVSDLEKTILEIYPDIGEQELSVRVDNSIRDMDQASFSVSREAYSLEIVYLDGTRTKKTLIRENIKGDIDVHGNFSVVYYVPKDMVETIEELEFKKGDYSILKEDSILSFNPSTNEIIYVIGKQLNLEYLDDLKVILLHDEIKLNGKVHFFTGYFSFFDFKIKKNSGIFIGIAFVLIMLIYLYFVKFKTRSIGNIFLLEKKINSAFDLIDEKNIVKGKTEYNEISNIYKNLNLRERKIVYPKIQELIKKIEELKYGMED